jgi:acyl transferase domain-containing protein/acyl carrier protein
MKSKKKTIFIYSGEGTHHNETRFKFLQRSLRWSTIEKILDTKLGLNLEHLWENEIGRHRCPHSPLLTTVAEICLADIWGQWGYEPDIVVGHSTGELAAAYQAGLYSLEEVLLLAYGIGEVAVNLDGMMLHGRLSDTQIADLQVNLSSLNFTVDADKYVTISDYKDAIEAFLDENPNFVKMQLPHPWHHPDYRRFSDQLASFPSAKIKDGVFLSGVTTRFETHLEDDYWSRWLVQPIDFIQTMATLKNKIDVPLDIIEIGFHPVLEKCCEIFDRYSYASSMFRGEDEAKWILNQRKKLDQDSLLENLKQTIAAFRPNLDFDTPLAYQGFGSLEFTELSTILEPYFPSLAPQDFYRYNTINLLIQRFGTERSVERSARQTYRKNKVVISAMSCRFPSAVETPAQFWEMLLSKKDQVKQLPGRGGDEAGFLNDTATRFDHQYFGIPPAEAHTMDPQQILALELTEMLWRDAGIDPETLDRKRVGVYLGVWNQEYQGDRSSVFYPTGTNPSIIASRISYHYDLRGPSWVSNTACSSSLVAIHYALRDIESGRIDYAIAGGVNMLIDEVFTKNMSSSGFLSKDNRCKVFDNSANGYVRGEGGGLVLLANKSLADKYYVELVGSAVNQNGRRSQLLTAPDPSAQEELIEEACDDAGIRPQDIAYLECHGTGTKIGDPIEISAIKNTVAKDRKDPVYVGSVKSNIGHLESAAGIAGVIKSIAILSHGLIPPNLHFHHANEFIGFESQNIRVVAENTAIEPSACIGISSFGFGGTNAHIIVRGVETSVRKEIKPVAIPFDRERGASLSQYLRLLEPEASSANADLQLLQTKEEISEKIFTREDIVQLVENLFAQLTSIQEIDPDIELTDQGLDSLSGTELIAQLEKTLNVELDPDILFDFPLPDQFIGEVYALATGLQN